MAYKYYFFYNILCVIILQSFAKQLSLRLNIQPFAEYAVAPYVGAWIETSNYRQQFEESFVAPYVGAWIETVQSLNYSKVDLSHPTWVRGLKHNLATDDNGKNQSHPTWVRGLKPYINYTKIIHVIVAPYVGAWIETLRLSYYLPTYFVAPYVGAWIETSL